MHDGNCLANDQFQVCYKQLLEKKQAEMESVKDTRNKWCHFMKN